MRFALDIASVDRAIAAAGPVASPGLVAGEMDRASSARSTSIEILLKAAITPN